MAGKNLLVSNDSLCAGCRVCQMLCDLTYNRKTGILNPKRAHIKVTGQFPKPGGFKIELEECSGCGICAKFCPTGALSVQPLKGDAE